MRGYRAAILVMLPALVLVGCYHRRDLRSELRSSDPTIREAALRDFTRSVVYHQVSSPEIESAIPVLIECLRESNSEVRNRAIDALGQVGPAATQALCDACKHEDARIRSGAIFVMGHVNERMYDRQFQPRDDEQFFPLVLDALRDQDAEVRKNAARSLPLLQVGAQKTTEALKCLLRALDDPDSHVRGWAARSIGALAGTLGNHDLFETAVKRIARFLKEEDRDTRLAALIGLHGLTRATEKAVLAIASALQDEDEAVRSNVYFDLSHDCPAKELAIPFLVKAFDDKNKENRFHVLHTLRCVGPLPESVAHFLVTALKDESPEVRSVAVMALGDMEHPPRNAMPILREMLKGSSPQTRVSVAWALHKTGDQPDVVLPPLLAGLHDDDSTVRESSARVLGDMGSIAKSAVPLLERVSKSDSDEKVRIIASSALRRILHGIGE
jgi:HEAT repeat protein